MRRQDVLTSVLQRAQETVSQNQRAREQVKKQRKHFNNLEKLASWIILVGGSFAGLYEIDAQMPILKRILLEELSQPVADHLILVTEGVLLFILLASTVLSLLYVKEKQRVHQQKIDEKENALEKSQTEADQILKVLMEADHLNEVCESVEHSPTTHKTRL